MRSSWRGSSALATSWLLILSAFTVSSTLAYGQPAASPTVAPPSSAEVPNSTTAPAPDESSLWRFAGGAPLGTYLYATQVAEFALFTGSVAGLESKTTGFRYAERGGYIAGFILGLLGAGAQRDNAVNQGKSSVNIYGTPGMFSKLNFYFDLHTTALGGNVRGKLGGASYAFSLGSDTLPTLLDIGIEVASFEEIDAMDGSTVRQGHAGITTGLIVPLSRLAQIEARGRFGKPTVAGDVGLTVNAGNYLFGRVLASYTDGMGVVFTAGGRM